MKDTHYISIFVIITVFTFSPLNCVFPNFIAIFYHCILNKFKVRLLLIIQKIILDIYQIFFYSLEIK